MTVLRAPHRRCAYRKVVAFRGLRALAGTAILVLSSAVPSCLPASGPALLEDEEASAPDLVIDGGSQARDVDLGDPFALHGVLPSHGPFSGKTTARLSGRGFSSRLRVEFGVAEVAADSVLASDPTHAVVVTPPGPPGFVDVTIRDSATAEVRVLEKGFFYDAVVADPDTGTTSGGTRIALTGSGTTWEGGTSVTIGGLPCTDVEVTSPTRLECTTAPAPPGAKDIEVATPSGSVIQARDAFTYDDFLEGSRGGLSGGVLDGRMRVVALDAWTGAPLAGATIIAGGSAASAIVTTAPATGIAEITGITGSKVTITVAAKCHQPFTFVDVGVDVVTAYLDPVLDISCYSLDPQTPGGGSGGRYGGIVEGQLVFPGGAEFQRVGWTTVPSPARPTERRAAYAFQAGSSPLGNFVLPPADKAITPETAGTAGYGYSLLVAPGNVTLYLVAGIEDRSLSPPKFIPYAMGVARGVSVVPQARVTGVDVKMDILFDHVVTLAPRAPQPGEPGPDRLSARLALSLGTQYAILPNAVRTLPLPTPETIPFVGVPSLDRAIAGEDYVLGAVAGTGQGLLVPTSVVSRVRTSNANEPVVLGGFLDVPQLSQPGTGTWTGKRVEVGLADPSAHDLMVVNVSSAYGLVVWSIVAPRGVAVFDLPDLDALSTPDTPLGLVHGPISTTVHIARILDFSYSRLRSAELASGAWNAYAAGAASGVY